MATPHESTAPKLGQTASTTEHHEDAVTKEVVPAADDHHKHIEGNALLVTKDGQVRRIPVPSNDPSDPLNFKPWEKWLVIFTCCWFSIISLSIASGLGGILGTFFGMYIPQGHTPEDVVLLITIPTLAIGLGNYIILPLSLAFGRRPIFLASVVVVLAACIAAALQNSLEGHLAARTVAGVATGATESLLPLMLTEVTFLHERAMIFGIYWTVQNILSNIINLTSTYVNHDLGWQWYYWIFVITVAAGLVFALFGAFETQFSRPATSLDGQVVVTDEFGVTTVLSDSEAQEYLANHAHIAAANDSEGLAGPRKTYVQRLTQWVTPHPQPLRVMLMSWVHMAESLTSPGILYSVLVSSITLGCSVCMSLNYNAVLVSYGWDAKDVGLINIGAIIGALAGNFYCIFVGDPFLLFMARRNKGVHLPEHHLIVLAPAAVIGFGCLLLFGFTAGGGATWWGPYMAYTIFQFSFLCVLISSTAFASEAAPKHPGPALVVVVGSKNIISFGVTYGLTPMVANMGYEKAYGTLAAILMVIFLLGIPVYFINPKWRQRAAEREARKGITSSD